MTMITIRLCRALAILVLSCLPRFLSAEEQPDPNKIIEASKAASGGDKWDKIRFWYEAGTLSVGGMQGTYEAWCDLSNIHDVQAYVLGPSKGSQGWNGQESWSTDSSDQVRLETSRQSIAVAIKGSYQSARAFLFSDRYPAEIKYSGRKETEGKPCDVLTVKPKDADPFEIWFDQSSHLPVRMVDLVGEQPQTSYFSDFRDVDGLLVPFRARISVGDPKYDQTVLTQKIEFPTDIAGERFDPPKLAVGALDFPSGQNQATISFQLINNHIYLPVSLDGKSAAHFIFDTGATNIVDTTRAKVNGIKTEGSLPGGGFGDNIAAFGMTKIGETELAGAKLKDQVFYVYDLGPLASVEGVACDGLVGYEIARRAVVRIDYENSKMTIMNPDSFHPSENAVKVPFKFSSHVPMVEGEIDGVAGEFEIDTGNRSSLAIMRPFAERNHLREKYKATTEVVSGYGVGGPSRGLLVRPHTLKIGTIAVDAPVGMIELDEKGASSASQTAGNIGSGLLKRFTLTLDYANRVLYLERNANFSRPDIFDRSGLWVMNDGNGVCEVKDVVKGSPGAKAGLEIGDHILAIDGATLDSTQIAAVREKLKQPPGTQIKLKVQGKNGQREVMLTLEELI